MYHSRELTKNSDAFAPHPYRAASSPDLECSYQAHWRARYKSRTLASCMSGAQSTKKTLRASRIAGCQRQAAVTEPGFPTIYSAFGGYLSKRLVGLDCPC